MGVLIAASPRPSDGLGPDSPTTLPPVPWYRWVGSRLVLFFAIMLLIGLALFGVTVQAGVAGSPWTGPSVQLAASILAYWLLTRWLESRRKPSEWRWRRGWLLLTGLGVGSLICLVAALLIWLLGGLQVAGTQTPDRWQWWLYVLGAVAGISEEIVFRGVLHRLTEHLLGTWGALLVVGSFFGLAHLGNPSATLWGAVAIALEAGVTLGVLYSLTRSLWLVIGVHASWNIVQGLVVGSVVSGSSQHGNGILVTSPTGPDLVSGGGFGIEASLVSVLLWAILTAGATLYLVRSGRVIKPLWVRPRRHRQPG